MNDSKLNRIPVEGERSGIEGVQDRIIALVSATNDQVADAVARFEEEESVDSVGYVVTKAISDGRIKTFEDAMAVMVEAFPERKYDDRAKAANAIRMAAYRGEVSIDRLRFDPGNDFVVANEIGGVYYHGDGTGNDKGELVSVLIGGDKLNLSWEDLGVLQMIALREYGVWENEVLGEFFSTSDELVEFIDRVNNEIDRACPGCFSPKVILKNGVLALDQNLPKIDPKMLAARIKASSLKTDGLKHLQSEMSGGNE
jgi:hypothetical protein